MQVVSGQQNTRVMFSQIHFLVLVILIATFCSLVSPSRAIAYFSSKSLLQIGEFEMKHQNEVAISYELNSSQTTLSEEIINGSFENGLSHWQVFGHVQLLSDEKTEKYLELKPLEGQRSAELSQIIDSLSEDKYLFFDYKIQTDENLLGFDEPSLVVKLDSQVVFTTNMIFDHWQSATVPLPKSSGQAEISFIIQNTGDSELSPRLSLANISTKIAAPFGRSISITSTYSGIYRLVLTDLNGSNAKEELVSLPTSVVTSDQGELTYNQIFDDRSSLLGSWYVFDQKHAVNISEISRLEINNRHYLEFPSPITRTPISKYQLVSDEEQEVVDLQFTNRLDKESNTAYPSPSGSRELLFINSSAFIQNEVVEVKGLDLFGNIIAQGLITPD